MLDVGLMLFLFLLVPVLLEVGTRLLFYFSSFSTIKKEWLLLVDTLKITTYASPKNAFKESINGFKLTASGRVDQHNVFLAWSKPMRDNQGKMFCKVELKNPRKVSLDLCKGVSLLKRGNMQVEDAYFQEKFKISTNNEAGMQQVLTDDILQKIRRVFATELEATLKIECVKNQSSNNDLILDVGDQYFLVYSNLNYQIKNKTDRLFIERTLGAMLDIAQRIDALN
ncbi:hypothetical protein [Aureispira anguillae]|uniref:Uncharacterized protein n=1 Tax=Aureispira anguillae TaxID=2864201 RepID=A0A916DSE4_9BACT|nr:hypothetical protein [Aureispira anguillae]BDS11007.1 hypothetical protein AsAng_0017170 [Aureispira anguillae]